MRALDDPMLNLLPLGLRGQIAYARGDLDAARPALERYAGEIGAFRTFIQVGALSLLAAVEVAAGDLARSREICAEMRAISARDGLPLQLAGSCTVSAAVEALAGDVEAAEALLAEARACADAVDQPWAAAELALVEAALAARRGDVESAVAGWSHAYELFDDWDGVFLTLVERVLEPLRAQLSEDAFQGAWEGGRGVREPTAASVVDRVTAAP